jgi:hypothetical protein
MLSTLLGLLIQKPNVFLIKKAFGKTQSVVGTLYHFETNIPSLLIRL